MSKKYAFVVGFVVFLAVSTIHAGDSYYDRDPINYSSIKPGDRVTALIDRVEAGKIALDYDKQFGYLPALLEELGISTHSQTLVFSKTSLQLRPITPDNPRALYFNDEVYIGYVRGGELIEISATDPNNGAIFYTLEQARGDGPVFKRETDACLTCHGTNRTANVPGHLIRSVYTDPEGNPVLRVGTFDVDHTTPVKNRWGGWYVTGTHGDHTHLGNQTLPSREAELDAIDVSCGSNIMTLEGRVDTDNYLEPTSDIAALMVLEHQVQMHNLITRANYQARLALKEQAFLNEVQDLPKDTVQEATRRRIEKAGVALIEYMLMKDEAYLEGPIKGTGPFQTNFEQLGPFDKKGRSLRQLDLDSKLFKYPCSYLIYSDAFDQLPPEMLKFVYAELFRVLNAEDRTDNADAMSTYLSRRDRKAILEILRDTKKGLPKYFFED